MSAAASNPYADSALRSRLAGAPAGAWARACGAWARSYFASDARRAIVSALGALWLIDGLLQFQPYMYSGGFISLIREGASGQPLWLGSSIDWAAHVFAQAPAAWNTAFALIQVLIGIGLLYRPTVKPALVLSFAWALVVWWVGEAFGFLLMQMGSASPLTGAPGAAALYALIGAAAWPTAQPGGLLGVRRVRAAWLAVWLLMAWLWLQFQNSMPDMISGRIRAESPSGMGWLTSVQHWAAAGAEGNGLWIALVLAAACAAIGVAVAADWHARPFLVAAIVLNLLYWVVGQGFGGIFTGQGTDPNSGPLFILFALVLYTLPHGRTAPRRDREAEIVACRS